MEFKVVDHDTIDEYLYEINTGFLNKDAEKLFDRLDFIFIDGDANLLPWMRRAQKFLILMRMCKRTNKVVLACSCAMQMLVYLCATNFSIVRVINGKGRGGPKSDIYKIR